MNFNIFNAQSLWIIAGIALMILEFLLPGFVVFFFGVGALVTGLACMFFDISFNIQLLIFIIVSLVSLVLLKNKFKKMLFSKSQEGQLEEFIGHQAEVISDMVNRDGGQVSFKGSSWSATSDEEIKKGVKVVIKAREGLGLKVVAKNKEA